MKRVATVIFVLATLGVFATTAVAQEPVDYKVTVRGDVVKGSPGDHFLTFDTPVSVPNATLAAGTYIFTMEGSSIVRVRTADRTQQLAMFFTAPVTRLDPTSVYEVSLVRAADASPRRITTLFLPNMSHGVEFIYTSDEARGER
jgi:hypothetical protein